MLSKRTLKYIAVRDQINELPYSRERKCYYRLKKKKPRLVNIRTTRDFLLFIKSTEKTRQSRRIAITWLPSGEGVSTVFLWLDHGYNSSSPILFETMVYRDGGYDDQQRYFTYDGAIAGHWEKVKELQEKIKA